MRRSHRPTADCTHGRKERQTVECIQLYSFISKHIRIYPQKFPAGSNSLNDDDSMKWICRRLTTLHRHGRALIGYGRSRPFWLSSRRRRRES